MGETKRWSKGRRRKRRAQRSEDVVPEDARLCLTLWQILCLSPLLIKPHPVVWANFDNYVMQLKICTFLLFPMFNMAFSFPLVSFFFFFTGDALEKAPLPAGQDAAAGLRLMQLRYKDKPP